MSMVWVTVRHRDHKLNWQQLMDRDSVYFQDFRYNVEADLEKGCSITIKPAEESDGIVEESGELISTRWHGLR